jgi:drug/metabolite transporter (DMT)-like permease
LAENNLKLHIFCVITILFFSTIEVVGKLIGNGISPYAITAWRFSIGGFIMLPFALNEIKKNKTRIKAQDYLGFALVGILNVCISMLFLQFSIFYGKANLAALIVSSNPLFVTIFAAALISETITKLQIIELGIGLTGLILIILGESEAIRTSANLGMAIIFGLIASTTFALSTVYSKKLVLQHGNMITLCSAFFIGSATLLIYSVLTHKSLFFQPTIKNIGLLLYLGIFVSGIAYILYFSAMKVIGAAQASIYFFLKPAFACTLAWLIHNEALKNAQIIGIILIMLSLSRKYFANLIFGTPKLKAD